MTSMISYPERLDDFLHAADQRHRDGVRRHRAAYPAAAAIAQETSGGARARARRC
jgi:hypothetical protein